MDKNFQKIEYPEIDKFESIGAYFKEVRERLKTLDSEKKKPTKKFHQMAVADYLGLSSPQYISNFERGLYNPSVETAVKLAELYGVDRDTVYRLFMRYSQDLYTKKIYGSQRRKKKLRPR